MNPSRQFILRPVATSLLMFAILLAGLLAYRFLPVSALPEVDYPTIQVTTLYPGASPEVTTSSITAPLERQFGQMPGLNQMSSISSGGASVITLQFTLDVSLDVAEQEVQAAINTANTYLPTDLPMPPIYSKVNPADTPVMTLAITSNVLPLPRVADLVDTRLAQKLSQLPGVGLVSTAGGQRPAVRIQVNPKALAAKRLNLDDVRTVIGSANVNSAKGSFDGPERASTLDANDQLRSAAEYRQLVIAWRDGAPIRLADVADVVDGAENDRLAAWAAVDGVQQPAIILNIQRQPGANVIETVDRIKRLLSQLQATLPSALDVHILTDRTTMIRASIDDVRFELLLAIALVVMVIFVFLRNASATLIPGVAVPLSLVGAFGVMYLAGFSINNLTLMAMTIATGFVVDDAIVMIENIARYVEAGEPPMQAALKGSGQIGFTIISLTLSLIAVLIPLLFMSEVIGRLFREFAVTLAVSILISAVVSLTLTPMMCARLLRHAPAAGQGRLFRGIGAFFDAVIARYDRMLVWALDRQGAVLLVALATLALTALLYVLIPKGFFPVQDTGLIQGISEAPQSISFPAMAARQQAVVDVLLGDPAVESISSFIGVDGANATLNTGRLLISLKPKGARKEDASAVIRRLQARLDDAREVERKRHASGARVDRASQGSVSEMPVDKGPQGSPLEARMDSVSPGASSGTRVDRASQGSASEMPMDKGLQGSAEHSGLILPKDKASQHRGLAKEAALGDMRLFMQPVQDLGIENRVSRTQYQFSLEDADAEELAAWTPKLLARLRQLPELADVAGDLQSEGLQVYIDIDRASASRLGISVAAIDSALYSAFGQRLVSTIFTQSSLYRVVLEVKPEFRLNPASLNEIYLVSTAGGAPVSVPLSAIARIAERKMPLAISRIDQFPAATISFNLAPGVSLGEAVRAIQAAERELSLPAGLQTRFQGAALAFQASLDHSLLLILAAVVVMYIVLGVLYESYIHPVTILSTLPSAGVGALLALMLSGTDIDIVAVIGIILLIGIVKKNAIMMIDFALEAERMQGKSPRAAIHEACLLRFRPILMTTLAALLGALPLMLGSGVGSELRQPLGLTMVGGLLLSQVLTLFTTPVIYLAFDRLARRLGRRLHSRFGPDEM